MSKEFRELLMKLEASNYNLGFMNAQMELATDCLPRIREEREKLREDLCLWVARLERYAQKKQRHVDQLLKLKKTS